MSSEASEASAVKTFINLSFGNLREDQQGHVSSRGHEDGLPRAQRQKQTVYIEPIRYQKRVYLEPFSQQQTVYQESRMCQRPPGILFKFCFVVFSVQYGKFSQSRQKYKRIFVQIPRMNCFLLTSQRDMTILSELLSVICVVLVFSAECLH